MSALSFKFDERMTGFITLDETVDYETGYKSGRNADTRCDVVLTVKILDMDAFVSDPKATADVTGYVDCPELGGRCQIEKGQFNLLVDVIPAYKKFKDLRYRLLFRDKDGRALTFSGVKFVDNNGIFYMWRDTTKLFTKIFLGDVPEGDEENAKPIGAGILHLKILDFAKTMTTFRSEPPGFGSWLKGNWLYFTLFAKRLWQVYGLSPAR